MGRRDRQTETDRQGLRERETDRQIDRYTDRARKRVGDVSELLTIHFLGTPVQKLA